MVTPLEAQRLEGLEFITQAPQSKVPSTLRNILKNDPRAGKIKELRLIHENEVLFPDATEGEIVPLRNLMMRISGTNEPRYFIFARYESLPDQSYYWTPEWQADEREADEDIKAGRVKRFPNVERAIEYLNSKEE